MGSMMGHRIDYYGVGILRGQRHISTQKSIPVLPPAALQSSALLLRVSYT